MEIPLRSVTFFYSKCPTAKSLPHAPTFWAKFSDPRVGPLRRDCKKNFPLPGFLGSPSGGSPEPRVGPFGGYSTSVRGDFAVVASFLGCANSFLVATRMLKCFHFFGLIFFFFVFFIFNFIYQKTCDWDELFVGRGKWELLSLRRVF